MKKKLIEVALPLEKINAESSREKSIRHGHPSTLHLWWARRPLAAARAVIWASLVDDPSEHPEAFPTEEEQTIERQRLFKILEELVVWENSNNDEVLAKAKAEIVKSTGDEMPELLDPFSGGGTIPLEGQRLGLHIHAHDLNPVAIMINKATTEIPARFVGHSAVNPESMRSIDHISATQGIHGLIDDVNYYSEWIKNEAQKRIGYMYPQVTVPAEDGGGKATVIAWIWARTTKCPNPACGCEMPLTSSFVLSKKKGAEAWAEPIYNNGELSFAVHKGKCPKDKQSLKMGRSAIFKCPVCGEITTDEYVKNQGKSGKIGQKLMAIIAEGKRTRIYVAPDIEHIMAAQVNRPDDYPDGTMSTNPRWFSPPAFGMTEFCDLFSNRQLTLLTTLCDLVAEVKEKIVADAIAAGMANDYIPFEENGTGATAYSEALAVYLSFIVDREANYSSTLNGWSGDFIIQTFGRQALPMVWDYAESNPFSNSTGNWTGATKWVTLAMERFSPSAPAEVKQFDAQSDCGLRNLLISTDPPYYDNIGYADLSDYFYIWMRRMNKVAFPKIFRTMLVPKAEELVAIPHRFDGDTEKAKNYFEDGMLKACQQLRLYAHDDYPLTIYYAFKQSETKQTDNGAQTHSSGWETMLSAIIHAGMMITGTWPMHTERETGFKASVNALASSIVLVCRKRPENAPVCTRRNFINELKRELRPALQKLQRSNIAPVDLAQSAIGPGMGVYSKYSKVLEADGTPMTVRSALQIINQELDIYFNEQDGELDRDSRFCVDLYSQFAFNDMKFGDADTLARAKNTSVAALASAGVVYAQKGVVHLLGRDEIPEKVDTHETVIWLLTQQLTRAMETGGVVACAQIIAPIFGSNGDRAKDLAYRLFTIADKKGWAQEAYAYNALVTAWPDIQSKAAEIQAIKPEQLSMFD